MTITVRAALVAAACTFWACNAASSQPLAPEPTGPELTSETPTDLDDDPGVSLRALVAPTPEMLTAALTNDPDAMREAAGASVLACQAASTCPAQFGSCTSWSTPSVCAESCGPAMCFCRPIRLCEGEPPEPKGSQTINSFRVCFDPAQHACTEWTNTTSTFCGC
jgi:hypothetical protein